MIDQKSVESALDINDAVGLRTTIESIAQLCLKKFLRSDESLQYQECSGRPSTIENGQLRARANANTRMTVAKLAKKIGSNDHKKFR